MVNKEWQRVGADIFWGEVAPCDHVLQIYETDAAFLDALAGFVGGGINAGECVIVIATAAHLKSLEDRLTRYGIHVSALIADDRYLPFDADETLSKFMVGGWPDEMLFMQTISSVVSKGTSKQRNVRAFGEMVALLWARGFNGATVALEHLWNKFCVKNKLSLFCAYPKIGFTQNMEESMKDICHCHSKLIHGSEKQLTEVVYAEVYR
ncbi:MAG TPA: MEDS domain-containing protein [Chitinophagaceae bacterium]|nr:MEDS domain-containing protein [Chitinophagaceae bacterium]